MSEEKKNFEIFKGKTLSGLFKDIYENSTTTKAQVNGLIEQLKRFIKTIDTAAVIVPLIREYMEVAVRSDEHLVRMADIVQRMLKVDRTSGGENLLLTEEEKSQLLDSLDGEQIRLDQEDERKKTVDKKMEAIQDKINEVTKIKKKLDAVEEN